MELDGVSEAMMAIWYEVNKYRDKPFPVQVEKITDKSIWIDGRRNSIVSEWSRYFSDRDDAVRHLIAREESIISYCEAKMARAKEVIKALKE